MNSRASQRADELAGADPANRAPLAQPRQLAGRSWPRVRRRGARFGDGLETDHLNGRPGGREATRCAVRPLRGAGDTSLLDTLRRAPYVSTPRFPPSILYSPSAASVHKVQAVCHVGSSLLHRAHRARMVGSCSPLLVLQVRGAPFVRAPPQQRYAARSYGPLAGGVKVSRCPAAPEGNPVDCGLRQVEAA